jgi:drug/metabolite transporter (DMT)-like permease
MDWSIVLNGEFSATACGLFWAIAVILFKKSGEKVPPIALNLFKGTIGLILFFTTLAVFDLPFFPPQATNSDWVILLLSGALGIGVADTFFFASLNRLGAGRTAIVDCLYSPFVILCSVIYLDEPLTPWLFVAISAMGVAILLGTWKTKDAGETIDRRRMRTGVLLGLLSLLLMAISIVAVKPILNVSEPWWATSVRLAGGWAVLLIFGALPSQRRAVIAAFTPNRGWWVTVPASVLGTYLALIFWILGMKHTHTTTASVLNQMSVIFMMILATIFLREPLTSRKALAIALGFGAGLLVVL